MEKIGVIGAGVMGRGVAQSLAQSGYKVIMVDINEEILSNAKEEIVRNIRFQNLFKKEKKDCNHKDIISNIKFTTDYELLNDVMLLIENVTEDWEVKKNVYEKIEDICSSDCIFIANTSAISITKIASLTKKQGKVIGVHFMNPVHLKPMVEVIPGYHTEEDTIEKTKKMLNKIGKQYVIVNDLPGFVSNRVLMPMINEAIYLVHENVASAEDVDKIFINCFSHKMGPLATADLIGLDTILKSIEVLYESYNDSKYRPCPLLKKMVDAGLYGMKSGKGFFNYN